MPTEVVLSCLPPVFGVFDEFHFMHIAIIVFISIQQELIYFGMYMYVCSLGVRFRGAVCALDQRQHFASILQLIN